MIYETFREIVEIDILINAKKSYSVLGSNESKGIFSWDMDKKKMLVKDIKKRKPVIAYRTYSLSEKEWNKYFDGGYTEIGNKNIEKGLTSLTLDKKMLNRFKGGGDITIELEIKMKEYTEILDDSIYPEEKEILGNDIKWKVTDLDDNTRNWYIIGEQI